jgi:CubicO group peptidase (beta-lactamase class C family)
MDSELLTEMWTYIEENGVRVDSVTIVRHGYLVLDAYTHSYKKNSTHDLYSCTKSVTSALVGIAIDQEYIQSVDQPVLSFFPERTVANVDARKEAMKLEHLLTMTDSLDWVRKDIRFTSSGDTTPEMRQSSDWVQFTLDRRMVEEPGNRWNYNGGASHLLSAIIQETTGMTAFEFAEEHLFGPLGISKTLWSSDPQGRNGGGGAATWCTVVSTDVAFASTQCHPAARASGVDAAIGQRQAPDGRASQRPRGQCFGLGDEQADLADHRVTGQKLRREI